MRRDGRRTVPTEGEIDVHNAIGYHEPRILVKSIRCHSTRLMQVMAGLVGAPAGRAQGQPLQRSIQPKGWPYPRAKRRKKGDGKPSADNRGSGLVGSSLEEFEPKVEQGGG